MYETMKYLNTSYVNWVLIFVKKEIILEKKSYLLREKGWNGSESDSAYWVI
jgi:hypothetical protein